MLYERTHYTERNAPYWRTMLRIIASKFIDKIGCNGIQTYKYLNEVIKVSNQKLFFGNMAADNKGLENDIRIHRKNNNLRLNSIQESFTFLFIGQIIPRKGVMELIRAWSGFYFSSKKNAELLILGGWKQKIEVQEFISNNSVRNVKLLGSVDYSNVFKYYAKANIFIMPTLEDNWSLVVPPKP